MCGTDNTQRRRLGNRRPEGVNDYSSTSDGGTFFSDRRLKFGIQTIQNATEKLQRLRGVLYEFKNQEDVKHVKNCHEVCKSELLPKRSMKCYLRLLRQVKMG